MKKVLADFMLLGVQLFSVLNVLLLCNNNNNSSVLFVNSDYLHYNYPAHIPPHIFLTNQSRYLIAYGREYRDGIDLYDFALETMRSTAQPPPPAYSHFRALVVDDILYMVSMGTTFRSCYFFSYNLFDDIWTPLPEVPSIFLDLLMFSDPERNDIYLIGENERRTLLFRYNLHTQIWEKLSSMHYFDVSAAFVINNETGARIIYSTGGRVVGSWFAAPGVYGADKPLPINLLLRWQQDNISHNASDINWHKLSPMNHRRIYHTVHHFQNKLYAIGGNMVDHSRTHEGDSLEIYDISTDTWNEGPRLMFKRADFGSYLFEATSSILVCGGQGTKLVEGTPRLCGMRDVCEAYDIKGSMWHEARWYLNMQAAYNINHSVFRPRDSNYIFSMSFLNMPKSQQQRNLLLPPPSSADDNNTSITITVNDTADDAADSSTTECYECFSRARRRQSVNVCAATAATATVENENSLLILCNSSRSCPALSTVPAGQRPFSRDVSTPTDNNQTTKIYFILKQQQQQAEESCTCKTQPVAPPVANFSTFFRSLKQQFYDLLIPVYDTLFKIHDQIYAEDDGDDAHDAALPSAAAHRTTMTTRFGQTTAAVGLVLLLRLHTRYAALL